MRTNQAKLKAQCYFRSSTPPLISFLNVPKSTFHSFA